MSEETIRALAAEERALYPGPFGLSEVTPEQREAWNQAHRRLTEEQKRVYEQLSDAEVPGFHARTVIDDTIGKLFAIRQQLRVPVPEGMPALLDDIEELVERAIDLAYDPEAEDVDDGGHLPETPDYLRRYSYHLAPSKSDVVSFCSCGNPCVNPLVSP